MNICPAVVNSTGLVLDIAGVVLLIVCPPPGLSVTPDGADLGPWENLPPPERRVQNRKRYRRHQIGSKVGFVLIVLGFMLQLASNWTKCA